MYSLRKLKARGGGVKTYRFAIEHINYQQLFFKLRLSLKNDANEFQLNIVARMCSKAGEKIGSIMVTIIIWTVNTCLCLV